MSVVLVGDADKLPEESVYPSKPAEIEEQLGRWTLHDMFV